MKDYVNSAALQEYTTKLVAKLKTMFPGTPTSAATVADMTDHSKTYVYVGSETGYTAGDWYYWDGTAWTSGGPFQATSIITDTTLAVAGEAADAKATGDAIAAAKTAVLNAMAPAYSTSATYAVGDYVNYNGSIYRCTTAITTAESWTSGHWTAVVLGADLASQVSDLKTQITFQENVTGAKPIAFTDSGYINTAGGIGATVTLTPTPNGNLSYAVVDCSAGDKIIINGRGWTNGRLWAFLNSSNVILSLADSSATGTNLSLIAPENSAKCVINVFTSDVGECSYYTPLYLKDAVIDLQGKLGDDLDQSLTFGNASYFNYFNDTLTLVNGGTNWSQSDYIDVTDCYAVSYKLYKYLDPQSNIAVAYLCFFDEDKELVEAYNGYTGQTSAESGIVQGIAAIPDTAKYVVVSVKNSVDHFAICKANLTKTVKELKGEVTAQEDIPITITGKCFSYYNSTLRELTSAGFSRSDYIDISGATKINYKAYKYIDPPNNIAVAYVCLFDESKNLIEAYNGYAGQTAATSGVVEGEIYPPDGTKYIVVSIQNQNDHYTKVEYPIDGIFEKNAAETKARLSAIENANALNEYDGKIYGYTKKINFIGDSITQGVGSTVAEDDSYVGILRKMFFVENDMEMNYGFESFTAKSALSVSTKMVDRTSSTGFTEKWNGSDCYGSDEYSSSTANAELIFTVKDKFNYMKVSYKAGTVGSFSVKAGSTTLTTVNVTSGTTEAALTDAIDISDYDAGQQYSIVVNSGTVTVSGVELGMNANYPTLNNYGRSGIGVGVVTGQLLVKESDCDILVYALGVNGEVTTNAMNSIADTIKSANNPQIIVLSVCMKSVEWDSTSKIETLRDFATYLGAEFIDMYSLIPKDSDGYTDLSFFAGDGLHPSPLGHRCIADKLAKTLHLSVGSSGLAQKVFGNW